MLHLDSINAYYGPVQALRNVSLDVREKEIVSLIGANGAGKSTLLMSIFGHPRIASGKILFKGQDISNCLTHQIGGYGISQVPEGRRIFPKMTVHENLLMGTYLLPKGQSFQKDLDRVLAFFPRLKERLSQRAGTLSGGEQQMLAIGRALMGRPSLLLLDEPSLGLAPLIVRQIFEIVKVINDEGTTVFLVEQNALHALRLAHRAYVMVNGEIRMSGTGQELLHDPEVKRAYLGSH